MPRLSSSTPSVIRIAIGVASPLVLGLVAVINSTPVFLHMSGDAIWLKSHSEISLKWRAPKSGSSWSDVHSCLKIIGGGMDSLITCHSTWLCWVITSKKKVNAIILVSKWVVWKYLGEWTLDSTQPHTWSGQLEGEGWECRAWERLNCWLSTFIE